MRLNHASASLPFIRDSNVRDRWGNRWGIENHVLSPVISERTEPTHTSVSSPISTASISTGLSLCSSYPPRSQQQTPQALDQASQKPSSNSHPMPGHYPSTDHSSLSNSIHDRSPSNQTTVSHSTFSTGSHSSSTQPVYHRAGSQPYPINHSAHESIPPPHPISSQTTSSNQPTFVSANDHSDPSLSSHPTPLSSGRSKNSSQPSPTETNTHHQHAINILKHQRLKIQNLNRQRDLEVAKRQIAKRIEKERRDQMIIKRDEIVAKLVENPNDSVLVRDLGKLYLEFSEPDRNEEQQRQAGDSTKTKNRNKATKSEPSLKLAIHYLEQSIQLDNRDPLSWFYLGRAWSLLLAFPVEHVNEREQRLSNSSLAFRKAIIISSHLSDSNYPNIQRTNRFRVAYAKHLQGLHRYQESASVLQDALESDENDVECWWELGRVMEMWALDSQSEDVATQQERVERMKHSCEAYHKAADLEPDDVMINQSRLDGEKVLESLKAELEAEEGLRTGSLKTEEDIKLTAEAFRAPNVSPTSSKKVTAPHQSAHTLNHSDTGKSSMLSLKKLVADLKEIPAFGKKGVLPSKHATSPLPIVNESSKPVVEDPLKSIDNVSTQVESVVESSPARSPHEVNPTQALIADVDPTSMTHINSPTHSHEEPFKAPEPSQLLPPISKSLLPHQTRRYCAQVPTNNVTLSSQDFSPSSTRSQEDDKSTVDSRAEPVQSPADEVTHRKNSSTLLPVISDHNPGLNSYQPPSPSSLPTSRMQSLSARLNTPMARLILSPESSTTSRSSSLKLGHESQFRQDPSQPVVVTSTTNSRQASIVKDSGSPILSQPVDGITRSKSRRASVHHDRLKSEVNHSGQLDQSSDSDHRSQNKPMVTSSSPGCTTDQNFVPDDHPADERNRCSSLGLFPTHLLSPSHPLHEVVPDPENQKCHARQPYSPRRLSSGGFGEHTSHLGFGSPPSQESKTEAEDGQSLVQKSRGTSFLTQGHYQSLDQQIESQIPTRSPQAPLVPPRPNVLGAHSQAHNGDVNHSSFSCSLFPMSQTDDRSNVLKLSSNSSPASQLSPISASYHDRQLDYSLRPFSCQPLNRIERPTGHPCGDRSSCTRFEDNPRLPTDKRFPLSPSASLLYSQDPHPRPETTQPMSSTQRFSTLPVQTNVVGHSPPKSVYNYSLIDSHLKSILEIDRKRKEELKEIKKQIRKTDEWAENQRRTILEEIRRICTPLDYGTSCSIDPNHPSDYARCDGRRHSLADRKPEGMVDDYSKTSTGRCDPQDSKCPNGSQSQVLNTPHHPYPTTFIRGAVGNLKQHEGGRLSGGGMDSQMGRRSSSTPPESHYTHAHHHQPLTHHHPSPLRRGGRGDAESTTARIASGSIGIDEDRIAGGYGSSPNNHHPRCYQPFNTPTARPRPQLKSNFPSPCQQQSLPAHQFDEFDKIGPAGFAINGITSIIQLLNQPRQHHQPPS